AVGLHVAHLFGVDRDVAQRGELARDVVEQRIRGHVDKAPAEVLAIAIRHVRADDDADLGRTGEHLAHPIRIAGVESAGHVRARDDVEQRVVTRHLAEIGVQVHAYPSISVTRLRATASSSSGHVRPYASNRGRARRSVSDATARPYAVTSSRVARSGGNAAIA